MKNYRSALLFTGIVLLLASGAALYHDRILGCIALGISLVLMGGLLLLLRSLPITALPPPSLSAILPFPCCSAI